MKYKNIRIKEIGGEESPRQISGHAAMFGTLDHDDDIILPGAFADSIKRKHEQNLIKFLWQHNHQLPLGPLVEIEEDAVGLRFRGEVLDTSFGEDALKMLLTNGDGRAAVDRMSFGFEVIKSETVSNMDDAVKALESANARRAKQKARTFTAGEMEQIVKQVDEAERPVTLLIELDLWEVSPVTFAANDRTRIDVVKGLAKSWNLNVEVRESDESAQKRAGQGEPESKAGRVLSKRNESKLRGALASIQEGIDNIEEVVAQVASTDEDEDEADDDDENGSDGKSCSGQTPAPPLPSDEEIKDLSTTLTSGLAAIVTTIKER